ncbi:hypothetical protein N9L92_01360, partial [Saprospiraceae bacterium]|nr:hypothetical protein [Saprospiraceae bacterium]
FSNDDLDHKSKPLQIFCNSNLSEIIEYNADTTLVVLNKLPKSIHNYNQVKVFTYIQDFDITSNSTLRSIPNIEIINDRGVHYSITKKLQQLKSHELNMAALYLGQVLASINPDYSIYKMKSVAVISFLSEFKNAQIREALYDDGIKEIFSSVDDYNLLPGIFSDTEVQPIVLIEDGLIDSSQEGTLIKQVLILEELGIAGVEILVIDNNKLIKKEKSMIAISEAIAQKNKIK